MERVWNCPFCKLGVTFRNFEIMMQYVMKIGLIFAKSTDLDETTHHVLFHMVYTDCLQKNFLKDI